MSKTTRTDYYVAEVMKQRVAENPRLRSLQYKVRR